MEHQSRNTSMPQERTEHQYARYSQLRSQFLQEQQVSEEAARFSLGQAHDDYVVLSAQLADGVAYFDRLIHQLDMQNGDEQRS